jgi:hypothetical protein
MKGISGKVPNPLEKGTGHGIIGTEDFIKRIRRQSIESSTETRELPAVKRILAQVNFGTTLFGAVHAMVAVVALIKSDDTLGAVPQLLYNSAECAFALPFGSSLLAISYPCLDHLGPKMAAWVCPIASVSLLAE